MKRLLLLLLGAIPLFAQHPLYLDLSGPWRMQGGDNLQWARPDYDDSGWQAIQLPHVFPFHEKLEPEFVWLRRAVDLSPSDAGAQLALTVGAISEIYEVWVNGVRAGSTGGFAWESMHLARPRTFLLPAQKQPRLTIALRLMRQATYGRYAWRVPDEGPYLLTGRVNAPWGLDQVTIDKQRSANASIFALGAIQAVLALILLAVWTRERSRYDLLSLGLFLVWGSWAQFATWLPLSLDSTPWVPGLIPSIVRDLCGPLALAGEFAAAVLGIRVRSLRLAWWLPVAAGFLGPALPRSTWDLGLSIMTNLVRAGVVVVLGMVTGLWSLRSRQTGKNVLFVRILLSLILVLLGLETGILYNLTANYPELRFDSQNVSAALVSGLAFGLTMILLWNLSDDRQEKQRLSTELEAARVVQQFLLPQSFTGTELFASEGVYEPAQEVGGDFYWMRTEPDGALLVAVGDVSGKGLKAAMLVSVAVGALRNERSSRPGEILGALNASLAGHTGGGFVTCCCARFDADGQVTLANAGHPSPYSDGLEVAVEAGLPLGIMAGVEYEESVMRGERFTFVSDGVVEAENAQRELFGFDRTREISTKSAQEIADAAKAWGQNDDITVVTVRRKP